MIDKNNYEVPRMTTVVLGEQRNLCSVSTFDTESINMDGNNLGEWDN